MKQFNMKLLDRIELKQVTTPGFRYYVVPTGEKYPSVTTVLGSIKNKGLEAWKKHVGQDNAKKIVTSASNRGTALHKLCENYILGNPVSSRSVMPTTAQQFKSIRKYYDNINTVYGVEIPLFSHTLRTAGSCDLFVNYNGINTVLDLKTSGKIKKEEYIENYFLQCTVYALMIEEYYKIKVPQIGVIIAVEHEPAQVFIHKKQPYVSKAIKIFTEKWNADFSKRFEQAAA